MAKKYRYSVTRKKGSRGGMAGLVISIMSAGLLLASVIISFIYRGNGDYLVGAFGLLGFMLAVYGFTEGVRALLDKNSGHILSTAGTIASGVMAVVWLCLFLLGVK